MTKNKKCDRCGGPCQELWELCTKCEDMLETPFDVWQPIEYTNEDDLHDSGIGFSEGWELPMVDPDDVFLIEAQADEDQKLYESIFGTDKKE